MTAGARGAIYDGRTPLEALHRAAPRPPGAPEPAAIEWAGERPRGAGLLRVEGTTLRIAPFVVRRFGVAYASGGEIEIALAGLAEPNVRILAVHDFRIEDRDPDLSRARAAVLLARKTGGRWQAAEDPPLECRAVALLGTLDVGARRVVPA